MRILMTTITVLTLALAANAETVVIEFGDLPNTQCGTSWEMSGLPVLMSEWTSGGCIAYSTSSGWLVSGGSLLLDLTNLDGLSAVSLEYYDYYTGGGTSVYVLDGETPVSSIDGTTAREDTVLTIAAIAQPISHARILVRNAILYRMSFDFAALPLDTPTWGAIKAVYR